MFCLLLLLTLTKADETNYIFNSTGLYIWNTNLNTIKNYLFFQKPVYLYGTLNINCKLNNNFYVTSFTMKQLDGSSPTLNYITSSLLRFNQFNYYDGDIYTAPSITSINYLKIYNNTLLDFIYRVHGNYESTFLDGIRNVEVVL